MNERSPFALEQDSVNFWKFRRNKITDLYRSEKKFFLNKIKNCNSFLDFGCAAGGFSEIIKSTKKKNYRYTGIDFSNTLISIAKKKFPKNNFKLCKGRTMPPKISKHDMAFSFGTLHHVDNYLKIISQMINLSKKYTIFDLRFTHYKSLINKKTSYQQIKHGKNFIKKNHVLYNVLNLNDFVDDIMKITSKKYSLKIYGYPHKPHVNTTTPYKNIIMASVLINKLNKFSLKIDMD